MSYKKKYEELKEDIITILTQIMCECDLSQGDGIEELVQNFYNKLEEENNLTTEIILEIDNMLNSEEITQHEANLASEEINFIIEQYNFYINNFKHEKAIKKAIRSVL